MRLHCEQKMVQKKASKPRLGEENTTLVACVIPKPAGNGFKKGWIAMAQDATMILAQDKSLGADDFRVFLGLVAHIDFENLLVLNQAELARELDMHRQHVQRSIKRLMATGAILEGPRIGVSRSYRFNPNFGWKGSAKNHVTALDEERSKRMAAAGITGIVGGGRQSEPERDTSTLDMFENTPV